jgi:hypothetical protein
MFHAQEEDAEFSYECSIHDLSLWGVFLLALWFVYIFAPSSMNQCKNFFIIGFCNHSSGNHCLDLVRALMWNSRVLSIQAYYCLSLTK